MIEHRLVQKVPRVVLKCVDEQKILNEEDTDINTFGMCHQLSLYFHERKDTYQLFDRCLGKDPPI